MEITGNTVKQELDAVKITGEICGKVIKSISASSACDPDCPSASSVFDPVFHEAVAEAVVFSRKSSDAKWCLEPALYRVHVER